MSINEIFARILHPARTLRAVRSSRRGQFRRAVGLSVRRLVALSQGRSLEVTLERTLVALQADNVGEIWFNQFNVAAGVGGGPCFNRAAVDLGMIAPNRPHLQLQLAELKGWRSSIGPIDAINELFAYTAWLVALRARGISPYNSLLWQHFVNIELVLIAPATYFEGHGGVAMACEGLERAERELEGLRRAHEELKGISFRTVPVALPLSLTAAKFVQCFDQDAVNRLLAAGKPADSVCDVLRPDSIRILRELLQNALL